MCRMDPHDRQRSCPVLRVICVWKNNFIVPLMLTIYDWSVVERRSAVQISLAISALTKISVTIGMDPFQSQEEGCTTSQDLSPAPEAEVKNLELHLHVISGIQSLAQRMERIEACLSGQHT